MTPLDLMSSIELRVDPEVAPVKGEARWDLRFHPMKRPLCFHDADDFERFKTALEKQFPPETKQ